ncbi:MAG TPA: molecular chaperone TorD family protein [Methylomirabilota bacterium]|nr:molecular chaperone TorD family protein [Methylomirabilota bacterium]
MIRDGSILSLFGGAAPEEEPGNAAEASALAYMQGFVAEARGIPDLAEELRAEHTGLFVLPAGVIPHEAFYLDPKQRLGGRLTIEVDRFYQNAGIPIHHHPIEMSDHLGLELEFMAALCRLQGELEDAGDVTVREQCVGFQRTFLEEHLGRWAPECCENVVRHARYGFYKAIARFTAEFVRADQAHIGAGHAQGVGPCEPVQP